LGNDPVHLTYAYDGTNRLTQKNVPPSATGAAGYSVYYGYDVDGLQLTARFGSASGPGISTSYDGFGRVASTTTNMDGVARTAGYSYDAHGNRLSMSLSSGYYLSFAYDAADRMTSVSEAGPKPIAAFAYDAMRLLRPRPPRRAAAPPGKSRGWTNSWRKQGCASGAKHRSSQASSVRTSSRCRAAAEKVA
jgi:YD repeat-containing protein